MINQRHLLSRWFLNKRPNFFTIFSLMFFFQTWNKSQTPRKFKRGPVSMAKRAKVPIVPMTILGTGRLMPAKKEYLRLGF